MKYLCLVYHEETKLDALSDAEYDAFVEEERDYREELRQSGHYVISSPLQPGDTATTIRVRHGKLAIASGPTAEAKEHLRGFYLIDATDLNDAIRVAARMPPARLGAIEVRPLKNLDPR
jgi:hypothetical protein